MVSIRRFNDFVEFGREDVEGSISGRFERQVERHPDGSLSISEMGKSPTRPSTPARTA